MSWITDGFFSLQTSLLSLRRLRSVMLPGVDGVHLLQLCLVSVSYLSLDDEEEEEEEEEQEEEEEDWRSPELQQHHEASIVSLHFRKSDPL
ncbi:unnamed protein product [Pleuronectes platessa]|uniref:Uncharacterized protein n=1 Tax=Pleuronectes platessa TaxID=8262 RepID=A0A9N7U6R2_PLEPL|nr:unnamed protein product [Pleuronectes platessa]